MLLDLPPPGSNTGGKVMLIGLDGLGFQGESPELTGRRTVSGGLGASAPREQHPEGSI